MWFTETPWPPFTICLLIAAVCFARWVQNANRRPLYLAIVFLALGGVIVVVESLIVTEPERIEAAIEGLADAFRVHDIERCRGFFSAQDPKDRELIAQAADMVTVESAVRITDLSIQMTSAQSRALAKFRANADIEFQGQHHRARTHWEVTWQREGNDWKIVRVRRLKILGDDEVGTFSAADQ